MPNNKEAKILFWDVEVAPILGTFWGLFQPAGHHENIVEDWWIICGAWKFAGGKTESVAIKRPGNDKAVVKKLRDVLSQADIIVHHNGDKFDIKKLNARLIYYGFDPLPLIPTVDTLKEVRKIAKFSSNKLDYLGKVLLGQGKIHVDPSLWHGVRNNDKTALEDMVTYNKMDVEVLEGVYNYLRPYMKTHPHVGAIEGKERTESCNKCGSTELKKNGLRFTAAGLKKQELQCKCCGAYMRVPIQK